MQPLKISCLALSMLASSLAHAQAAPKYVFYLIGDGMAATQRQVTEYYLQQKTGDQNFRLTMNNMPIAGINTTHSLDSLVTDSAASGTALATGVKTDNGIVGMTKDGKKTISILESARDKGMATGLITTTRLTHATPSAFIAKNMSRNNENEIAEDYLASNIDYLAGGGYRHFVANAETRRTDKQDLSANFAQKGYQTFVGVDTSVSFRGYTPKKGDKVFAAFTSSHLPYEIDRMKTDDTPSLKEITDKAIQLLSTHEKGFFLMVEGGRIDHAAHANDIASVVYDTLAFDQAVQSAVDFYHKHPKETLIVVTGDHETGGMGLGFGTNYFMNIDKIIATGNSIEDKLQKVYQGDRQAMFDHIAKVYQLNDLNAEETALINQAMDAFDKDAAAAQKNAGGYDPVAIAVAHVTSKRAGVYWTSFAHTATQLPLTAIGNGAEQFGGFKDNTEVANAFADVMGLKIGVVQ
ncbi:alkaline phosphatase [Vibrio sp. dsl-7]|uniref:Alkaline phosphatase n=1 Tax=Vibrio chanodichtyis TaxID=3027932 RepID=A0ABT5V028_9VIBR|nr:alkaline phosphatase [Vibrio chanodichtyis]MDE1513675.1 alkaline phosphatase [Vibrio chanodichtyis]